MELRESQRADLQEILPTLSADQLGNLAKDLLVAQLHASLNATVHTHKALPFTGLAVFFSGALLGQWGSELGAGPVYTIMLTVGAIAAASVSIWKMRRSHPAFAAADEARRASDLPFAEMRRRVTGQAGTRH